MRGLWVLMYGGMLQGPKPGGASAGVARNTFAVFMQPTWSEPVRAPAGVPPSAVAVGQWADGQDFIAFTKATLEQYY